MTTHDDNLALVEKYGLKSASVTPTLGTYLRDTWNRRAFISELANASSTQQYADSLIGRLWQLFTPILNAGIYFLMFGVLLGTRRGVENYPAFLIAGVFAFNFMQTTVTTAQNCINKNARLVSAIHFPKLVLPLATIYQQLQQYVVTLGVLVVLVLITGEPLTWSWLLLPIVIFLQLMFTTGFGLMAARVGARSRDIGQLLPFFMRTWRYVSGVFFSITVFTSHLGHGIGNYLTLNPGAVYLDLLRDVLMKTQSVSPSVWVAGVVWSFSFFGLGLVYFFRGENTYV